MKYQRDASATSIKDEGGANAANGQINKANNASIDGLPKADADYKDPVV
jgi:hypothetical protein